MSLYKEIETLLPYLKTVRKLENYLSFDMYIPKDWRLLKKYVDENKVMESESNLPDFRVISFVSEINETSLQSTQTNIQNIVKYNLELEEKNKLFESKVTELKDMFEKQTLQNLQSLKFQIKTAKLTIQDDENRESVAKNLVGE